MRRHARRNDDQAPGQDSFLDIVANLVGILVILVMVIGVRARGAFVEAAAGDASTDVVAPDDVERTALQAARIERDLGALAEKSRQVQQESLRRFQERDQLLTVATAAERELTRRRGQLDEADAAKLEARRELEQSLLELEEVDRQRRAVQLDAGPQIIKHLPTPLAKTVFGREEHFRLKEGRLAFVPLNDMVERLKAEAPQKLWKLKDQTAVTETIGPVDGFRMRYTLHQVDRVVQTGSGPVAQRSIELDRFILLPVAEQLGVPLAEALQPGSDFNRRLASLDPDTTTVTVWTYPDSFEHFRTLRDQLYQRGYLCAARALPEEEPIGGSPRGTKSAAQ